MLSPTKPVFLYNPIGLLVLLQSPDTVANAAFPFILLNNSVTRDLPTPLPRYSGRTCIHSSIPSFTEGSKSAIPNAIGVEVPSFILSMNIHSSSLCTLLFMYSFNVSLIRSVFG